MAKIKETREISEVNEKEGKTLTKWELYFNSNICEDFDIIQNIAETANRIYHEKFNISINDWKLTTATFLKTFETFMQALVTMEKDHSEFEINLANRFAIGFNNNENDDDEKQGNFMVYMKHLREAPKTSGFVDPTVSSIEKTVQWNTENVIEQPELIRKITVDTVKNLDSIEIQIANNELIMPLFITFYECIITVLKLLRRDADAYEIQVNLGWFIVIAQESEDGRDNYFIRPDIGSKLYLKNDSGASANNE